MANVLGDEAERRDVVTSCVPYDLDGRTCAMCTAAAVEMAVDTIIYGLPAPGDSGAAGDADALICAAESPGWRPSVYRLAA